MKYVITAAALAAADLCLKDRVAKEPDDSFPREVPGTGGKLEIRKVYNPGFPFGFLKERPGLVKGVPLAVSCGIFALWARALLRGKSPAEKLALTLAAAGAASNTAERLLRGHAVDYLYVRLPGLDRAVWNLADLYVLSGGALLLAASAGGRGVPDSRSSMSTFGDCEICTE